MSLCVWGKIDSIQEHIRCKEAQQHLKKFFFCKRNEECEIILFPIIEKENVMGIRLSVEMLDSLV